MTLSLVTITQDNITWAVNENWRRIFDELQWKFPVDGVVKLQADLDMDNAATFTDVQAGGPGSAVARED